MARIAKRRHRRSWTAPTEDGRRREPSPMVGHSSEKGKQAGRRLGLADGDLWRPGGPKEGLEGLRRTDGGLEWPEEGRRRLGRAG